MLLHSLTLALALTTATSDNLWGGVQGGEEPIVNLYQPEQEEYLAAENQYPAAPAEYWVEPEQYQEQPQEYQEQAGEYQEKRGEYQPEITEYQPQPHAYQPQAEEYPAETAQYPTAEQQTAERRSDSPAYPQYTPAVFTPPPGAYPAPPGSFPNQAPLPAPTNQQLTYVQPPAQPRQGLIPAFFQRIRNRMAATSNKIQDRRSQVKGFFAGIRDMIMSLFQGPEGQARMFSLTSLIIGSILAL